jgi:hypothetical protein
MVDGPREAEDPNHRHQVEILLFLCKVASSRQLTSILLVPVFP